MSSARRLLLLGCVLVAALLVGCSPAVHKTLDPSLAKDLDLLQCRSIIQDEEVSVEVVVYKGLFAGGIIGNAVTANRENAAEERITPLLEQTSDVDFRRLYWDALNETMRDVSWIDSLELATTTIPVRVTKEETADRYLLQLNTQYKLTSDCLALFVATHAHFFSPSSDKAIYHGWLTYFSEPIGDLEEEAAILAWAENGAAKYRALLREGISENMRMLEADFLDRDNKAGRQTGVKKTVYFQPPVNKAMRQLYSTGSFKGEVLEDDGERVLFRHRNGNLWSLPLCSANEVKPVIKSKKSQRDR